MYFEKNEPLISAIFIVRIKMLKCKNMLFLCFFFAQMKNVAEIDNTRMVLEIHFYQKALAAMSHHRVLTELHCDCNL